MKQWRVQALLLGTLCVIVLTWGILVFSLQQHPSLDQRVQSVAEQVKCPICQGESIANSTTTIAFQNLMFLRVFSIRTIVATKSTESNIQIISNIIRNRESAFLSTDYII